MDRRYAEPLDVPALAEIAYLSESQFSRVFKQVFKQVFNEATIAWDVGFNSVGTFSRTFERRRLLAIAVSRRTRRRASAHLFHRLLDSSADSGFGEARYRRG